MFSRQNNIIVFQNEYYILKIYVHRQNIYQIYDLNICQNQSLKQTLAYPAVYEL